MIQPNRSPILYSYSGPGTGETFHVTADGTLWRHDIAGPRPSRDNSRTTGSRLGYITGNEIEDA